MLTREELEKMIENGETVWFINGINIDSKETNRKTDFVLYEQDVGIWFGSYFHGIAYEDLYKTKSDAEWKLKTTAVREERFEPPTWKEILKTYIYSFSTPEGNHYRIKLYNNSLGNLSDLYIEDVIDSCDILEEEATKENYTKAVELARKLFLGEKVEG